MKALTPSILLFGLIFLAMLGAGLFFQASYHSQASHVAQQNVIALDVAYRGTVTMHRLDVETRLKNQILRDDILDLLEQANAAAPDDLPEIRGWLYRALRAEYQDMVRTGLRQLHFHFPDGRSLLRFHSPAHFGDPSMFEIRPTLRIANTELRPVSGFEGGRILPGFRNVFPILREGRHLGSVELSLPFEAIHQNLGKLLPPGDYALLLHRDVVNMVFDDLKDKFVPADIHPAYFKENPDISQASRNFEQSERASMLIAKLRSDTRFQQRIDAGASFAMPVLHGGQGYVASFLTIPDVLGRHAAYLVSFTAAPALIDLRNTALREVAMKLLLLLLLAYTGWRLIRGRQQLALEKARLQTITESMSDALYVIDSKGKTIFVNQAACAITGFPREALLNQAAHDLFHRHAHDTGQGHDQCSLMRAAQNGESCADEEWFIERDGRSFSVAVSCRPMFEHGAQVGLVVLFRDISAQRETLERLRLQGAALDASANAIVITNADSAIEWANPAFTSLTGYTLEEAIGRKPKELIRSGLQPIELYQAMWQTILAGKPWRGELINRRKDGTLYHEELTITPVLGQNGAISHFIAVKQDISARKAEEAAAGQARAQIEALSARNQLLLNSAGEGIYGTNAQGHCVFINPAALDMLGYRLEDVLGQDQHRLFHHHRANGQPYPHAECPIHLTLRDGLRRDVEDAFIRRNGEYFDVHLAVTATLEDDRITGAVVVFSDITQRKLMEAELNHLASTDTLTGIANRRHFMERFAMELERVRRYGNPATLLMLDLDHFKRINDQYGHATGDRVLRHFTDQARQLLRKVDVCGRLGGEEFGILLPDTELAGASEFAERLRRQVAETPCEGPGEPIAYTVSIGLTDCDHGAIDADQILAKADRALYRAKASGRNRIAIDHAPLDP